MRDDKSNRARWSLYTDALDPVISVEDCDQTARRFSNPNGRNNTVECICCGSIKNVRDVVIGWDNHTEAAAKNYADTGDQTRSAMCESCRTSLRKIL